MCVCDVKVEVTLSRGQRDMGGDGGDMVSVQCITEKGPAAEPSTVNVHSS